MKEKTKMTTGTLIPRPYAGESDLEKIAAFLNLVEAYDQVEEGSSVSELREEFNEPSFDSANDLQLYENVHGELVGFAQLYLAANSAENDGFLSLVTIITLSPLSAASGPMVWWRVATHLSAGLQPQCGR